MNSITIARIGSHRTVRFAVDELRKYLKMLDRKTIIDVRIYEDYDENLKNLLWVGMSDTFHAKLPEVSDRKQDDAIYIDVKDFCGVVGGNNERSVLIAVYRFLKELGISFLHPGGGGEMIPKRILDRCDINVCEAADLRYRVMCIEGALSYEHVYNMIDWLPKVGMNGYFVQFMVPEVIFKRWYSHKYNEELGNVPFDREDAKHIQEKIAEDIADRSLLYHAVGHGWTTEPFGIPAANSKKYDASKMTDNVRSMLAMIDGKRELFGGEPTDTNLCYSNPKVVDIISSAVADYCKEHQEITDIVISLADMRNNYCECENCKKHRPSDLYVNLLNHIDEKMTIYGIETKVFMISYNELSWAPLKSKLNNPKRFILEYCPITRRFTGSYADVDLNSLPEEPKFELNKVVMPRTNAPIVRLMKGWDGFAVGGRCLFDYHLWTTTLDCDLGGFYISKILSQDIKTFRSLNINGLVSCQTQRYSYPNNLPMQVMAQTLWNISADYDEIVDNYYVKCYGKDYQTAKEYLEALSKLIAYWPKHDEADVIVDNKRKENALKALKHIAAYKPIIQKIAAGQFEHAVQEQAWRYLVIHTEIAELVAQLQVRKFSGESYKERVDAARALRDKYLEVEEELHEVFDVWRQMLGYHE